MRKLAVVLLVFCGCHKNQAEASPTPKEKPQAQSATQAGVTGEGSSHVAGPGFTLDVTPPTADVTTNAEQTATVTIKPTAGFHVNKDFPIALTISAPEGIKMPKTVLDGDDAAKLDETELDLPIKYTPTAAGAKQVTASIEFAVCTPKNCNPKKEMISFNVNAK